MSGFNGKIVCLDARKATTYILSVSDKNGPQKEGKDKRDNDAPKVVSRTAPVNGSQPLIGQPLTREVMVGKFGRERNLLFGIRVIANGVKHPSEISKLFRLPIACGQIAEGLIFHDTQDPVAWIVAELDELGAPGLKVCDNVARVLA